MATGLIYHPDYLKHNLRVHPENAKRLTCIMRALEKEKIKEYLVNIPPRRATLEEIESVHQTDYINEVDSLCREGGGHLDADTYTSASSFQVALLAAGGVLAAVQAVIEGRVENALALVRPPGHHAEPGRGMGFCIFNNAAIAARYAQQEHGLKRVLIIDWDIHHGNGTQNVFYDDPSVLYVSFHQSPHYPGTGSTEEKGEGQGKGYNMNFPLPPGSGGQDYLNIFHKTLIPKALEFNPEIVLISAGFDGHREDPLAGMNLGEEDFARFTDLTVDIAEKTCQGRIVSVLEGGYNLEALPRCVLAHLRSLLLRRKER
ncbi:histone deacetylase [candidate division NPL-UPA2 bacterium]|nr:histone deacetylase [candidate division NPL-UPA2 bacterium]